MKLSKFLELILKDKKNIILIVIIGILVGTSFYLLPKKYQTTGNLYVTRKIEKGFNTYFKYEGYYALQNASDQTLSIVEIIKSDEIKQNIILKNNIDISKKELNKIHKNLEIKKIAPQIIKIKTTANTNQESLILWAQIVETSVNKIEKINNYKGDKYLSINIIDNPVTTQIYYPLYICIIAGVGILFGLYIIYIYTYNLYLTKRNN